MFQMKLRADKLPFCMFVIYFILFAFVHDAKSSSPPCKLIIYVSLRRTASKFAKPVIRMPGKIIPINQWNSHENMRLVPHRRGFVGVITTLLHAAIVMSK